MKSRYLHIALACAFIAGMWSCHSGKETASSESPGVRRIACGKIALEPDMPHIDWFEANNTLTANADLQLPAVYKTYSLSESPLKRFFETAAQGKTVKTVVPLGGNTGCQLFNVKKSGTMSGPLADKYPGLVSLSGTGINGTGDIRLDFDGTKMNGQVIWKNEAYLISPVTQGSKRYYIIYKKSDATDEKQPFESLTK
ncbi:MAG: hypothetical protein EOP56_09045 [Sphingobacteriales bacterium]|nr:MAG: hypothetical protein EOP56_09045 [Sphingobacteriales bacterium]